MARPQDTFEQSFRSAMQKAGYPTFTALGRKIGANRRTVERWARQFNMPEAWHRDKVVEVLKTNPWEGVK